MSTRALLDGERQRVEHWLPATLKQVEAAMHAPRISVIGLAVIALTGCDRSAEQVSATQAPADRSPAAQTPAAATPAAAAPDELAWARAAIERNPSLEVLAVDSAAGVITLRDRDSGEVQAVQLADLAAVPVASLAAAPSHDAEAATPPEAVAESSDAAAADTLGYTVERSGGQVRVTGPGVSIVSAGAPAAASAPRDAGRVTVDPIICEGPRVLQLNDRHIFVNGDAVIARGGCQLHITNSRIAASGTGVVIRDATVLITNSEIEGKASSFDAGADARVVLRSATLRGAMRREEGSEVQDQGGNQWN
jgi:hypothetical protein